jgi:hypothetical protein
VGDVRPYPADKAVAAAKPRQRRLAMELAPAAVVALEEAIT